MALYIKDGYLTAGTTCADSKIVSIPRDGSAGPQSLMWGINRCNDSLVPLGLDADGNIGVSFSGSVTLGAVTIKDNVSGLNVDVVAGEGQDMTGGNNCAGFILIGQSPAGCSSFLHMDDAGSALVNITGNSTDFATESTLAGIYAATCQFGFDSGSQLITTNIPEYSEERGSHDLSASGNFSYTTTFAADPRKSTYIGVTISTSKARDFEIAVVDGASCYILQSATGWTGQNVIVTDPIRLSTCGQIKLSVTCGAGETGTLNYLVISDRS